MTINYSLIGNRIKAARKAKGLSQSELSELIDKSVGYMSYIETGSKKPSLETLIQIANALDVTIDELLSDNLAAASPVSNTQMNQLLSDCSAFEKRVILLSVQSLKEAIRTSKPLMELNFDYNYTKK
ncbi:MAG: helix-turn-helix domain-containing protein [Huintestinicola sp.]